MKRSVFILGRTPDLAYLELQSLYPEVERVAPGVACIQELIDGKKVMAQLGGTIKIVHEVSEVEILSQEALMSVLQSQVVHGKIVFGVSIYGDKNRVSASILRQLKDDFVHRGVSTRYIEAKHEASLSSVVIAKQHVVDLVIVVKEGAYILGITDAVQDFEDWNTRDFGRPTVDPHKGMLPPKVARMIVNIASRGIREQKKRMLLDPFCGVGTVVTEALLTGWQVIGSDISEDAIQKTEKNIAWIRSQYGLLQRDAPTLFVGDATHASERCPANSIDAVVTEPFMGDPTIGGKQKQLAVDQVKNTLKGLEKLYIGCLREWVHCIKSGGCVVIALPEYAIQGRTYSVKNVVDRCEILGYTLGAGPIEYSRPQAVVRRMFYVFIKK